MMRQIAITQTGGPDALTLRKVDVPQPKAGEILIRLVASGLNYIDVYHRTGLYPVPLPTGLGLEGAGIVEAIGEGVTRFKVGDRAAFCTGPLGAYADFACVDAGRAVLVPAGVDLEIAAAIMLKGLTAEFLIRRIVTLKAGDTVLFHAAAGGVGLIACSWLAHLGMNVIGTVGSQDKAALAKQHGCAHTILYRDEDIVARVKEITGGKKCRAVYDSVGADTMMASLDSAARRGLVVSFGNASGPPSPIAPGELAKRGSLLFTRPTLFDYITTAEELETASAALFDLVAQGVIKPVIGARFALEDASQAHRDLEARKTTGSTIFVMAQQ
jgi:NADPH:quinone reductase